MIAYAKTLAKKKPLYYRAVEPLTRADVEILNDPEKRRLKREKDERDFMNAITSSFSEPGFLSRFHISMSPSRIQEGKSDNTSLREIYMNSLQNFMKTENQLLKNHYYSGNKCVSAVLNYVSDSKEIEKLPEIMKNESSYAYQNFVNKSGRALSSEVSVLQNFVNRYAAKNSKEALKCEEMHLNEKSIRQIIEYYSMDKIAGDYLLSFHKRNRNNLSELINNAYHELIRTRGIRN